MLTYCPHLIIATQTQTVKYSFEDLRTTVLGVSFEGEDERTQEYELPQDINMKVTGWESYNQFMDRIYSSTPGVRVYVIDLFASSALNESRQVIVFHHNSDGANGKSTIFILVRRALGELHESCQSSLLSASGKTAAGGANEELMSVRSKRLVQLTEVRGVIIKILVIIINFSYDIMIISQ